MFLSLLLQSAGILFVSLTILFLIAIKVRNNSIIDQFWGLGFLLLSLLSFFEAGSFTLKKILVLILVASWSLRLSGHIFYRNKGLGEDFRYAEWRKQWKYFYLRSYFQVFMLQGTLMLLIASPLILIFSSSGEHIGFIDIIGILLFLFGFLFETLADHQLVRFRSVENKGELLTSGIWKYSRHPNYFGEALLWWGFWLMAVPEINGLFSIVSPLAMTILLRYISGVPLLEKKMAGRKGWEEYKRQVPPFIPRFRK